MRSLLFLFPALLVAQAPQAKPQASSKPQASQNSSNPALNTDDEKIIYSIGQSIFMSLSQFDLSPAELEIALRGVRDAAAGKPAVELSTWGPKIGPFAQARNGRIA